MSGDTSSGRHRSSRDAPATCPAGFTVGPWRAVHPLARTGPAGLWRGEDLRTGTPVAIKEVAAVDRTVLDREAAVLRRVGHEHLPRLLDTRVDDDRAVLVSSWAEGGTVAALLRRVGPLSAGQVVTVVLPVADAVAAAHRHGIVHGSIGAASVLLEADGRPLLADLGAVRDDGPDGLEHGLDERADDAPGGRPAADLLDLGLLALACLTGVPQPRPAERDESATAWGVTGPPGRRSPFGDPDVEWPEVPDDCGPPAFVRVVRSLLSVEPEMRPSAASVVMLLHDAAAPEPLPMLLRMPVPLDPEPAASGDRPERREPPDRPAGLRGERQDDGSPAPAARLAAMVAGRRPPSGAEPVDPVVAAIRAAGRTRDAPRRGDPEARGGRPRDRRSDVRDPGVPAPPSRRRVVGVALVSLLVAAAVVFGVLGVLPGLGRSGPSVDASAPPAPTEAPIQALPSVPPVPPVPPEPSDPSTAAIPGPADWGTVVATWTQQRDQALRERDLTLLSQVYSSESPARLEDAATITRLVESGLQVQGGEHTVLAVEVVQDGVEADGTDNPAVRLRVTDAMSAARVVDGRGQVVQDLVARDAQSRTLTVVDTPSGPRISALVAS
ncbi:protein kinase domain-containing protein [Nakamurella leprariae]|uniref:non-specific serine/threonine protein kinase n=1 Tax=Nakamurella leprariae TaxID=2803911 RepID=A0A938YJQ0_9ACTN|nr:protein kinase [Nakamurella leprariae]MBM9469537.1 protein kinase [Nakamurella leprariae]